MAPRDKLTPAEWEIMEAIWSLGGSPSVRDVVDYAYPNGEKAYTTVQTLMNTLERKELLTKRLDENAETAEYYISRCDQLQQEIDTLRSTVKQYEEWCDEKQKSIDLLKSERATLYRRNEKGQIVPITPKPRKPHTLKHGMTVKDPTPKQAEMIFREARRAGILSDKAEMPSVAFPYIWFGGSVMDCIPIECGNETYITATEFIQRIKGEVA